MTSLSDRGRKAPAPAGLPRAPASTLGRRRPAPIAARDAEVNSYLAAYIMGVANRLANGASNYYRSHFGMGMSEWRTMMAIGMSSHRIVREVAEMADLDYAAASKSLKLLKACGLVHIEQTNRRGRAAIASLTSKGLKVHAQLKAAALRRQKRLVKAFTQEEIAQLWSLMQKVEMQIAYMNAGGDEVDAGQDASRPNA